MTHYLNFIDEEDEEVVKINKRLIPHNYTFYMIFKNGCEEYYIGSTKNLKNRIIHFQTKAVRHHEWLFLFI